MCIRDSSNSYIDFTYRMHNDTYLIDFTIQAVNMEGKLAATNNYVDICLLYTSYLQGYHLDTCITGSDFRHQLDGIGLIVLNADAVSYTHLQKDVSSKQTVW